MWPRSLHGPPFLTFYGAALLALAFPGYDGGDCCSCTCQVDEDGYGCSGYEVFECIDPSATCVDDDDVTVIMVENCGYIGGIGETTVPLLYAYSLGGLRPYVANLHRVVDPKGRLVLILTTHQRTSTTRRAPNVFLWTASHTRLVAWYVKRPPSYGIVVQTAEEWNREDRKLFLQSKTLKNVAFSEAWFPLSPHVVCRLCCSLRQRALRLQQQLRGMR